MANLAAVVGIGQTKYMTKRSDVSIAGLVREAAVNALQDADLTWDDIDAVIIGKAPDMFEGIIMPEIYLTDALGCNGKPMLRVHTAGSVGGSTALVAASHVQSGTFKRVLTVSFEKQSESNAMWALSNPQPFSTHLNAGAGGYFAPIIREYMRRSKAPYDVGIKVAVKDRLHGARNPLAHLQKPDITMKEVEESFMLWDPIRFLESCPSSDGACAMVIANEELATKSPKPPAWIRGVAMRSEPTMYAGREEVNPQAGRICAADVYKQAGITNPRKDLDVAEIYVPFSWYEPMWLENLGFAPEGEGWKLTMEGATSLDEGGDIPWNCSGGVLSSNPIGASGMIRFAEAARQVRGDAGGHQVEGAKLAMGHAYGGGAQFFAMWIVVQRKHKNHGRKFMAKHFNIADLYEMVADKVPTRSALVCGEQRATFAELEQRANRLAHYLAQQGVKAGDHVGLYLYNCNEYLEGMLACFKIRAVPINVNYRYVQDELLYIFDNAHMVACIHNQEFIPHIDEVRKSAPDLKTFIYVKDASGCDPALIGAIEYESTLQGQSDKRDFPERADDDLFILYTGGTTGMPKGVMWPHKAVFFAAMGGGGWFHPDGAITEPEQIAGRVGDFALVGMALAPLMHGACWWYACIQLLAGDSVVLNPGRSLVGEEVWDIVAREKVNSISIVGDAMAVPLLDALTANPERWDLTSVFNVGSGGAVFSESKQEKSIRQKLPNVFITNSFGSSESGSMGLDGGGKKGQGLGNVTKSEFMSVIRDVAGEPHRHVERGEMGIFARSGHIPVGYYNDPVKSAKTIVTVDGKLWLLLGDEARLEEDDTITVYGRGSNCINSGGEKVFPEEVEQALKANPDIFDCLVVATPDERFGSRVTAVVAARGDATLCLNDVQEHARKFIAGYKVPRELHVVSEVPRAPSGKPAYTKALEIALQGKHKVA